MSTADLDLAERERMGLRNKAGGCPIWVRPLSSKRGESSTVKGFNGFNALFKFCACFVRFRWRIGRIPRDWLLARIFEVDRATATGRHHAIAFRRCPRGSPSPIPGPLHPSHLPSTTQLDSGDGTIPHDALQLTNQQPALPVSHTSVAARSWSQTYHSDSGCEALFVDRVNLSHAPMSI